MVSGQWSVVGQRCCCWCSRAVSSWKCFCSLPMQKHALSPLCSRNSTYFRTSLLAQILSCFHFLFLSSFTLLPSIPRQLSINFKGAFLAFKRPNILSPASQTMINSDRWVDYLDCHQFQQSYLKSFFAFFLRHMQELKLTEQSRSTAAPSSPHLHSLHLRTYCS